MIFVIARECVPLPARVTVTFCGLVVGAGSAFYQVAVNPDFELARAGALPPARTQW